MDYGKPSGRDDVKERSDDGLPAPPPPYSNAPPQHHQPGMHSGPQPAIVHIQQPTMVAIIPSGVMFSSQPTAMECPHCHQQIVTQVSTESGCCAYVGVGVCLLLGCWMGCCLIPLCMSDFQDAVHTCPNCSQYIGTYKRMGN